LVGGIERDQAPTQKPGPAGLVTSEKPEVVSYAAAFAVSLS
jgi:hypothetical protein